MQRNYSAREARKKREKEKAKARNAKNAQNTQDATNVSAGSLRPTQSSAAQQPCGAAQAQASSDVCYCLHVVHHKCHCCYACNHRDGLYPRRCDTTGWALDPLLVIYRMCACSI